MNTDTTTNILGIPLNRIVAFLGPYIAVGSGALAAWLLAHLHVFSLFHLTHDQVATAITQLVVFGITAGLTWLGHQKWLNGHQIELAAAVARSAAMPPVRSGPRPISAANGTASGVAPR